MDGRTDGQTEFSSLDRVCIACSAVKTVLGDWQQILAIVHLIDTVMPGHCLEDERGSLNSTIILASDGKPVRFRQNGSVDL